MKTGWLVMMALGGCAKAPPQAAAESVTLAEQEAPGLRAVEPTVEAEAPAVLLSGATVMTATGEVIEGGFVLMRHGELVSVSAERPDAGDAHEIDVSGLFITPGLIDTHSHLGVYPSPDVRAHSDGNEMTAPRRPEVWAEHASWPQDPGFQMALRGGVTTLQILPGSGNLIGGRGVVVHNLPHRGPRAMRLAGAPETVKMACGENPKRVYGNKGSMPSTRMGNVALQREAFIGARSYLDDWADYQDKLDAGEDVDPPERDLGKETLAGVLEGRVLPQIHCYRADDMLAMMQLADEFGFSIRSFHHALEAYKIRDLLAEHDIASSTWADWWGFKMEAYDGIPYNAALLEDAGARVVIHSDSPEGIQRLNQEAAKAQASGRKAGIEVSDDQALRWVTAQPAWVLGIDDQVGTLQPGKRADVVVWTHHPLSVYARARYVFIDGALRFDLDAPGPVWSDFMVGQEVAP